MAYNGAVNIAGNVQQQLVFTANTEAKSSADIAPGVYDVWSDQDCFIALSETSQASVTTDTGYPIFAGNVVSIIVPYNVRLRVISVSSGTFRFVRTG